MTTATHQFIESADDGLFKASAPLCEKHCDELQPSSTVAVYDVNGEHECAECVKIELDELLPPPPGHGKHKPGVFISIDRDGYTGRLQVSIGDYDEAGFGTGHRLVGPKYLGQSRTVAEAEISAYDAFGILGYILPICEAWLARREAEGCTIDRSSWPWRVVDAEGRGRQLGVGE